MSIEYLEKVAVLAELEATVVEETSIIATQLMTTAHLSTKE